MPTIYTLGSDDKILLDFWTANSCENLGVLNTALAQAGFGQVQKFTSSTRSTTVPISQTVLGWESDTGKTYKPNGVSAGNWTLTSGGPPEAHASSHGAAGSDPVTVAQSQVTGLATALSSKADLVGGKVPSSQLPSLALVEWLGSVSSQSAMLALTGQAGDFCFRSDQGLMWMIVTGDGSQLAHWQSTVVPGSFGVASVNGHAGIVVLSKEDIDLANVDDTSDAQKPISIATQAVLNQKVPIEYVVTTQGVAQSFELQFTGIGGDYLGSYFDIQCGTSTLRVWFNVENIVGAPSEPPNTALMEISISTGDGAAMIRDAVLSALTYAIGESGLPSPTYDVTTGSSGIHILFTASDFGDIPFPDLSNASFISFTSSTPGVDEVSSPAVDSVHLLRAIQNLVSDGRIELPNGKYLTVMDAEP